MTFPKWEHVVGLQNWSVSSSKNKENKNQFGSWLLFPFLQLSHCLARGVQGGGRLLPWRYQRFISTGILKPSVKSYDFPLVLSTPEGDILAPGLALQHRKDAVFTQRALVGETPHRLQCIKAAPEDYATCSSSLFSCLTLLNEKKPVNLRFQNLEATKKFILCFTCPQFLPLSEIYSDLSCFLF